ncbi:MAG: helix-hairpin-helix domain-containing protein [Proteobacteria bacterium]|nr:helix-hairpin-helix domain-containing protein [Pseudomonadota bacterium]
MMKSIHFSNNRHFLSMILLAIFITLSFGFSATAKPIKDKRVTAAAAAYENGEFDKALELFQAAYADDPQSSYLYNIGRVHESNANYPSAIEYYTKFIQTPGSDEDARTDAGERIENIKKLMSLTGQKGKKASGAALPAGGCIDINNGSIQELTLLSGIGDKRAQDIVAGRPYRSIDELDKVKGIGPATINKFRGQVCPIGDGPARVMAQTAPAGAPAPVAAPAPALAAVPGNSNCIDINNASQKDLVKLKGVGDKKAQDIIAGRPYHSIDDLAKIKGISAGVIAKMRDQVCPLGAAPAVVPTPVQPKATPAAPKAPANAPKLSGANNAVIDI